MDRVKPSTWACIVSAGVSSGELGFQLCVAEFLEGLQGFPLLGLTPLHRVPKMWPSSSNCLDAMTGQTLVTQIAR
jgi:hypothetical protein